MIPSFDYHPLPRDCRVTRGIIHEAFKSKNFPAADVSEKSNGVSALFRDEFRIRKIRFFSGFLKKVNI
jgi:hypothetical protein